MLVDDSADQLSYRQTQATCLLPEKRQLGPGELENLSGHPGHSRSIPMRMGVRQARSSSRCRLPSTSFFHQRQI